MESAGLRHRRLGSNSSLHLGLDTLPSPSFVEDGYIRSITQSNDTRSSHMSTEPPKFVIDLSRPPKERYLEPAEHFRDQVALLPNLFAELIDDSIPYKIVATALKKIAPRLLRRLYDPEEHAEIKGISEVTGIPLYLLVAFNTLVDLFMGCTSGGARVVDPASEDGAAYNFRMLHFRTLDWGMDVLRKIVVELHYVRNPGEEPIAKCLTYFGYVGVLTGVRKGLSVSLNFRPHHDRSTIWKRIGFRWHQLMVLRGWRRSISSTLRHCILHPSPFNPSPLGSEVTNHQGWFEAMVLPKLLETKSTAAYMIFCTPDKVFNIEKDNGSGFVTSSETFAVTLNHDLADENDESALKETVEEKQSQLDVTGMDQIVQFSVERKLCAEDLWNVDSARVQREHNLESEAVEENDVVAWLAPYGGVTNNETHYAAVMDPKEGSICWRALWTEPIPDSSTDGYASDSIDGETISEYRGSGDEGSPGRGSVAHLGDDSVDGTRRS